MAREIERSKCVKYSGIIVVQIITISDIKRMQMKDNDVSRFNGLALLTMVITGVWGGCYTEKEQMEGPEYLDHGWKCRSLDGSFERVTDLPLGSYAQGLIIKVRHRQSQLNVQSR